MTGFIWCVCLPEFPTHSRPSARLSVSSLFTGLINYVVNEDDNLLIACHLQVI